jgi:hypothetical protein
MPHRSHTPRTRHLRPITALLTAAAVTLGACSTNTTETETETESTEATGDTAPTREAAGSSIGWTVPANKGGNGNPGQAADVPSCLTRTGINSYKLCMVMENATRKLTATPNVWGVFPLTVSRYWGSRQNAELGGEDVSSYFGRVGSTNEQTNTSYDCRAECSGRLTPNPFTKSAMMTFAGMDRGFISGITTRLFVTSGESPMSTEHTGAQPYYDMPAWSATNYRWCTDGEYLTCKIVTAPDKGSEVTATYRIENRPLDVFITAAIGSGTTLQRVGNPTATGLLIDPVAESANATALKSGETARYGGYRATDGRTANLSITYLVGDADGNTSPTACAERTPQVLGCGSTIIVSVAIDKDGKADVSGCTVTNITNRRTFKCDKPVLSGDTSAPMTATISIRD